MKIETGLDLFLKKEHTRFRKERIGFLGNQASVDHSLRHASELILEKKLKLNVTCFMGPQHGIRGEKQDNMIESDDFIDSKTNIPCYSLYGSSRKPSSKILSTLDVLVIDLQDIGCRIYTFMYTMLYCMEAAKAHGKKVIILDRPNPIGGSQVEGNFLDMKFSSFVGLFPMSTRHGMTMGELALMFNEELNIHCDLEIIKIKGWKRKLFSEGWGRQWVPPSPNIPVAEAAHTFPGIVHFEGTNISEGRGTTMPFLYVGAPFINADKLAEKMNQLKLSGVYFRPIYFQPTFHKGKDQVLGGVHIHVLDRVKFNSFEAGLHLLAIIAQLYPKLFQWKQPPYEYETEKMPIDLIAGTDEIRKLIDTQSPIKNFLERSREDVATFKKIRAHYLLY
ncbi:MAG: DUF1343 domain-containing protein [Proteobacteria bacterium]|nr:DUF1343 domain-containing protein [Pseudomonadota bacterium]